MPRGDGTGPTGAGAGTGRGMGRAGARAAGSRQAGQGQGRGRMGGSLLRQGYGGQVGLGSGGNCVCPSCGKSAAHQRGVPCTRVKCPNCGSAMTRAR